MVDDDNGQCETSVSRLRTRTPPHALIHAQRSEVAWRHPSFPVRHTGRGSGPVKWDEGTTSRWTAGQRVLGAG